MEIAIVVIITVFAALAFDLINGFHDSANSIATIVSTRVLSPRQAVWWAAFFNFAAILFPMKVADTISKIIVIDQGNPAYMYVVFSGLMGAIIWDLLTWWWGLPTSSSHALMGGLVGAGLAYGGAKVVQWPKVWLTVGWIPMAPFMGLLLGFALMFTVFWIFRKWRPYAVDHLFRKGQLFSAALYSLGHGGNDAQKTMGIILVLFIAAGYFAPDTKLTLFDWKSAWIINWKTAWIILSCQAAIALGTAFGGWRIVKTMGMKITKLKPVGGFCAETAGALTLFLATHLAIPVSTTHTITGAIIGVGATDKFSAIKWGVAKRIVWAWVVTIPLSAAMAALCFYLLRPIIGMLHPGI